MAVLSCVPDIQAHPFDAATSHDALSAVFVPKTANTLESRIAELENALFREFFEAQCRHNLIPTSCWPHEK